MSSFYDLASLVMIPSGKKAGKVYSQKPLSTDGQLDFTRASTATRIGSDGLIEKTRTNLLLQSNSFDTTWVNTNTTETGGQSGYDGLSNAWELTATATSSAYIRQIISFSNLKTLSVYAKAGASSHLLMLTEGGGNTWFDLVNGIIETDAAVLSNMKSIGNGWYRCSVTWDSSITGVRLYVCDANGTSSVANGGNIYIQNAQLEQGLVATSYIPTTTAAVSVGSVDNMPRLNYTPGSATSCPSLLLEPQRTNLYPQSEYSGAWLKTNFTTTDNYAISPEGVQNAFRAVSTNTEGLLYISSTGTTGQDNTLSVYAKSNTATSQKFRFFANGNTTTSSDFTATNEWQRFDFTHNCTNVTAGIKGASSELSDILFYGFQQEAGSYATSYIPTFGATVTRVADASSKTGISSLIGQTEGTLFIDFDHRFMNPYPNEYIIDIEGGTNKLFIRKESGGSNLTSRLIVSGSNVWTISINVTEGNAKIALAYKSGENAVYYNGTQVNTSSATFSGSSFGQFHFSLSGGSLPELKAKKTIIFKTRLSNTQLAELTSIDS